jgi:hypothetical protein
MYSETVEQSPLTKQSFLVINNVNDEDLGRYVCRGTSGILDSESVVDLRFAEKGLKIILFIKI